VNSRAGLDDVEDRKFLTVPELNFDHRNFFLHKLILLSCKNEHEHLQPSLIQILSPQQGHNIKPCSYKIKHVYDINVRAWKTEITAVGIRYADHVTPSVS
jgi:hypothetical protein